MPAVVAEPSIEVMPVKTRGPEARFKAIAVVPMYIVLELGELSPVLVPETEASAGTVKVLDAVPPAIVNPVAAEARVKPLTDVGVIAPRVNVIAGVVVLSATSPDTPLAVVTDTEVTVPEPSPPIFPLNFSIACKIESVA